MDIIMMMREFFFMYLFITYTNIGLTFTKQSSVQGNQNVLLHEAVRTLLGFKDSSERSRRLLPNPDILSNEGPKYMMELYEKFKNNRISKGHLSGNTVRSIHAQIVEVNGETMFAFNLTSVGPTETLLSAEIHLYKKKTKKWNNRRDIELILYEIAPHYMSQDNKITMRAKSSGWQWYDVTNSILSCLAARRKTPHLFALNFKFEKPNRKLKQIALRRFIRHHSMPFLVIYSNDTQENRFDQLDTLAEQLLKEKDTNKDETVQNSKHFENKQEIKNQNSYSGNEIKLREKRSIFDNEIPEDPDDYRTFDRRYNIPQTHPGILQARRGSKHKLTDSRLIPYPNMSHRRKNRRRKRKNRKNKRKNKRRRKNKLLFPKEWDNFHQNTASEGENSKICGRKKLIVNFADIGWGDWIISPKSFEAHYCAGSCPFPLTKKLRPSNHATIQSMVHAIGIYSDIPAPCCVPDSMSSITLLYFDEHRNVVLKNYPSMTVNSCACR